MITIELFLDNLTGFITSFRTGWTAKGKKPNPMLTFRIYKSEFYKLVDILTGRAVILGTERDYKFGHNLYLKVLDLQNPEVHKGEFFNSIKKI